MKVLEGSLQAKGMKFALVVSRFNRFITEPLLAGAVDMLKRHQVAESDVQVVWVPGAFEIPVVTQKLAEHKKFDAIICLGAVIRGHTPHFDYVANEVSKGIAAVSMKTGVPVIFGILTTETIEQAIERAGTKSGNKGAEAAMNAIEMASLLKQF